MRLSDYNTREGVVFIARSGLGATDVSATASHYLNDPCHNFGEINS